MCPVCTKCTHTCYCGHSNLILLPALSDGSITVLPPEEIFSPSDTEGSLLHVPKPRRGRAQPRERPQSFYGRSSPRQHKETSVWKGAITNLTHARGESVYARLFVVCARVDCAVLYLLMNGGTNGVASHLVVFAVVLVGCSSAGTTAVELGCARYSTRQHLAIFPVPSPDSLCRVWQTAMCMQYVRCVKCYCAMQQSLGTSLDNQCTV